jgi:hypothetical protein
MLALVNKRGGRDLTVTTAALHRLLGTTKCQGMKGSK